jgi:hypothetical protein
MDKHIDQPSDHSVGTMGSGTKAGSILAATVVVSSLILLLTLLLLRLLIG